MLDHFLLTPPDHHNSRIAALSFKDASLLDYPPMKTLILRTLFLFLSTATLAAAQDVIPLYAGTPPGSTPETYPEKKYFSQL